MPLIATSGIAHLRLTVTDIARSKAFYDRVFGWPIRLDRSAEVDEPGVRQSPEQFYGGTVYQLPDGTRVGLRPVATDRFDPDRTGLDHLSFQVVDRGALERAAAALDGAGVAHGPITDLPAVGIAFLSFQDPDDINLELTAPLSPTD